MRDAFYVIALFVIGTFVVTWTLGRVVTRLREPLNVVGNLVGRVGAGVVLVLVAAEAAAHGGLWLVAVPVLLLPALWNFVLTAVVIWAWRREEPSCSH